MQGRERTSFPVMPKHWGWAGTSEEFLRLPSQVIHQELEAHHRGLLNSAPSAEQANAWIQCLSVMRQTLRDVCIAMPDAIRWGVIFEYELPLEGGRRPDVVVLAGDRVVVLEFKQNPRITQAAIDQVEAYARDLAEYHSESHGKVTTPILVLPNSLNPPQVGQIRVTDSASLGGNLLKMSHGEQIPVSKWLEGRYEPLPFLVAAARRIFRDEPLPHIKRALAADIPRAVELLGKLAEEAMSNGQRVMGFVAGVPGSGKTLAGLSLVYQRTQKLTSATFLSGNGPLVQVLRDALRSSVFVKDLHGFIRTYGASEAIPKEHVIVFDEAQRAWDADYMLYKNQLHRSEPDLLVDIAERLPGWAFLVGLVGDGQEIHVGEESGMQQWHDAIKPDSGRQQWTVHCPPRLASAFPLVATETHEILDLTVSLRSRRADDLHSWVASVLAGDLKSASITAELIHNSQFPMYLTRNLDEARSYLRQLYSDKPDARYGLLASSRSSNYLPRWGIDSSFQATKNVNLARWYNDPAGMPKSCCQLDQVVTEFGCQGLELDFPVVCWATDFKWSDGAWISRRVNTRYPMRNQEELRRNVYRVLLTRGRDGILIYIPPDTELDQTEHALLAAGVRVLKLDLLQDLAG